MVERRRQKLVVPDVTGLHWENAVIMLHNEGFPEPEIRYTESYEPLDSVVQQYPLKGQLAPDNEEIVLHVSKRSVARFLPSVYQSSDSGTDPDWLRNFLWIFQEIYDSVSRKQDRVHEQFSPFTADPEFLPWLAQWVGISLDSDWPTVKKRKMIRSAAELYQRRGTGSAIRRLLGIFTGVEPEIVENEWPYEGFWVGVHSTMGVDSVVLPPVNLAHCFIVRFPKTYEELGKQTVARIHQIIRSEKPAHTVYFLDFAESADDSVATDEAGAPVMAIGFAPAPASSEGSTPLADEATQGDSDGVDAGSDAAPDRSKRKKRTGSREPVADSILENDADAPAEGAPMPMGIGVAAELAGAVEAEEPPAKAEEPPAKASAKPKPKPKKKSRPKKKK